MTNQTTADIAGPIPDADEGWEYAAVEIFGRRSHYGRCREVERFGAKMLRVDIPIEGAPEVKGWITHFYGGSSIFSYTLTTMEAVLKANKPYVRAYLARPKPEPEDDPDIPFEHEDDEDEPVLPPEPPSAADIPSD
jgi:hypothetical protein